ncbi:hypothetical protein HYH03_013588 [Edaphochlamys debaryana]|uniref:NrS-1 polymerase-like helicase domain-containing protein n=1 Tax=Edaphochlamys debaryana TaxID=47281 RepID=A0A835XPD0_9CHLO|nr:hypothetical protein HYH03_013588 [Edaphochlamys debaryana]|eukprot:KAG2487743.1 hypothetical protein HYH03_013588 [Edaphochlamys debaryana]
MQREIRAHLAANFYWDVDFVNCQPSLMVQVLQHHEIPCPLLERYTENRDDCLQEVMDSCCVSRDAAKNLFIRLLYYGRVNTWVAEVQSQQSSLSSTDSQHVTVTVPAWVKSFQDELMEAGARLADMDDLADVREHCKRHKSSNFIGSVVALYLQTQERRCLEALVEAVQRDGRSIGALIHDGLHVLKESDADVIEPATLKKWSRAVFKKTQYMLDIAVKPFECNPAYLAGDDVHGQHDEDSQSLKETMTYDEMKACWENRVCKIIYPGGTYLRMHKDQVQVYSKQALLSAFEHVHYSSYSPRKNDKDGTLVSKRHAFLKTWLRDATIRTYDTMNVYPPPLTAPADEFNLWTRFDVERYHVTHLPVDTQSPGVQAIIEHLHILLGRTSAHTNYVLDWSAQLFQEPSKKTGIALLFKGEEGSGKNIWTNIFKLMMGSDKFLETSKPSTVLYGQFTSARRNKVLICINEANGKENHANNDVLKDMITSETFVCEAKGENATMLRCYDRFIFTTNNDNPVALSPDSRRFVVFDVSSELKGNTEYFKRLVRMTEDAHVRYEFYKYLMERDISRVDWYNDRPRTDGMARMIFSNAPLEFRYIHDLMLAQAQDADLTIPLDELFQGFLEWLARNRMDRYETNGVKFGLRMSKLIQSPRNTTGICGVSKDKIRGTMVYRFEPGVVLQELQARGWVE